MKSPSEDESNDEDLKLESTKRIRLVECILPILLVILVVDKFWFIQQTSTFVKASELNIIKRDFGALKREVLESSTDITELNGKNDRIVGELSQIDETQSEINKRLAVMEEEIAALLSLKKEYVTESYYRYPEKKLSSNDFSSKGLVKSSNSQVEEIPNRKLESHGKNRHCDTIPVLSPINEVDGFIYDTRIAKILDTLYAISPLDSINQMTSPQYKAACWILYDDERKMEPDDQFLIQRYVLSMFLFATHENALELLHWNSCDYVGFSCNDKGHVVKIDSLYGGIPGTIPTELSKLYALEYLNLSNNHFTGTISPHLAQLRNLRELYLNDNELTGVVPRDIGMLWQLQFLSVDSNRLEGQIPTEIGKLSLLQRLDLFNNQFSGPIPSQLYDCTLLTHLFMHNNHLKGTLSSDIQKLRNIKTLYIESNRLHGRIPSEIGTLTQLKELRLGMNHLTGPFPDEIGKLESIQWLVVESNHLTGTLPDIFENFTSFKVINIGGNEFSGTIPESFWNTEFGFAVLLNDNNFVGSVPEDFCEGIEHLKVDGSRWFRDRGEMECSCCSGAECFFWNQTQVANSRLAHRTCPKNNLINIHFNERYWIEDLVANVSQAEVLGFGTFNTTDTCVSPTGCYYIYDAEGTLDTKLSYSSKENRLITQEVCDAVELCGHFFDPYHPKRKGLNHITQLAFPSMSDLKDDSSNHGQALCWLMTKDPLFHNFHVCDGTLLQRFVMALFYVTQKEAFDFESFSHKTTCEWPGVTCDSSNKFIEHLRLPSKNLKGSPSMGLGLLTNLITIDLRDNQLDGVINPAIFTHLPFLERFDLSMNALRGTLPETLLKSPSLKYLNVSNNNIHGELPNDLDYSKNLERFDLGNNLFQGRIPLTILASKKLQVIDLSRNGFIGAIPHEFGKFKNLTTLKLHENMLSSTIPREIFDSHEISTLMLHTNKLTGSIPTEVGLFPNAKIISLSYNNLKGTIPSQIEHLQNLEFLLLHQNQLTGIAPSIDYMRENGLSFIADCGNPRYLLPGKLECLSCTICCNSHNLCQQNVLWPHPLEFYIVCATFLPAIAIILIAFFFKLGFGIRDRRDLSGTNNTDSAFCLVFADHPFAWFVYAFTAVCQIWLYFVFVKASDFREETASWQYTIRCPENSMNCINESSLTQFGWFLFAFVLMLYLGKDFINSTLQIKKAVITRDIKLVFSGCILLGLTTMALFTSFFYNMALAATNTDLIVNAVILLFINDLDEQTMALLNMSFPAWTADRIEEVEIYIGKISDTDAEIVTEERRKRIASGRSMLGMEMEDE